MLAKQPTRAPGHALGRIFLLELIPHASSRIFAFVFGKSPERCQPYFLDAVSICVLFYLMALPLKPLGLCNKTAEADIGENS